MENYSNGYFYSRDISFYRLCTISWIHKKLVVLVSICVMSIAEDGKDVALLRCIDGKRFQIPISSVHLQYTTYMIGIDIADQICEEYFLLKCGFTSGGSIFLDLTQSCKCLHNNSSRENTVATNTNDPSRFVPIHEIIVVP